VSQRDNIGFALWLLRSTRRLTQDELAARIPATTREQVSDWEIGAKLPTVASFERVCRGLEVSPRACLRIAESRGKKAA
jgi:transcriptional regulator with XRE-family HTH domain